MWEDIIPNLSQNLNHQDINIKKAAIMTLGFICEYLKVLYLYFIIKIYNIFSNMI